MHQSYQSKQINEALSVLYVALTRASHSLYAIIAPPSEKEKKNPNHFCRHTQRSTCRWANGFSRSSAIPTRRYPVVRAQRDSTSTKDIATTNQHSLLPTNSD